MRINFIALFFATFLVSNLNAQNNNPLETNFAKGFKDGFKKGYCYGNQGVDCFYPTPPMAPLPGMNENENSYQDGYNRGFTVGSDLFKSQKQDNRNPFNPPVNKFNPYVPQNGMSDEEMKLYAYASAKKKEEEARAMAAGAFLIAASGVGLIVVSNDFYVHKTIPLFYKADDLNNISTQGFDFGFRIRFKKSAFEYGATIYNEKNIIANMMTYNPITKSYVSTKNYISSSQYFGYNLAYNHSIFKPLTDFRNTKFYIGASLNGIFTERHTVGYSGQFGFNLDLIKRIKLDSRIEIGNYTKELKIGLIFNYKKRKEERL